MFWLLMIAIYVGLSVLALALIGVFDPLKPLRPFLESLRTRRLERRLKKSLREFQDIAEMLRETGYLKIERVASDDNGETFASATISRYKDYTPIDLYINLPVEIWAAIFGASRFERAMRVFEARQSKALKGRGN